jgi:type IV pilus assembly protein PilY1
MKFFGKILMAGLCGFFSIAIAGSNEISQAPLGFLAVGQAKPNIFFILDDSGSMQSSALGDEVNIHGYQNTIGYRSSLCNKIYYDPTIIYPVPVKHDGTYFPQQKFTQALYNGFNSDSVTVNLSSEFMPWRTSLTVPVLPADTVNVKYRSDCIAPSGFSCVFDPNTPFPNKPEAAHYFVYTGNKRSNLGDNSADDHCKDILHDLGTRGSRNWTKIIVGSTSGPGGSDEQQNFANWFSYHRTRILTMKTAIGLAFRDMGDQYRVGFTTIGYSGTDSANPNFLKLDEFSGLHREKFYDKLYAIHPLASTPLRAALSKAGRLYAGKLLTGADDPVRFSCQQNFAILSTDGYWNPAWETGSYGPKKIDGLTNVGDQDSDLPPPRYDGDKNGKALRVATLTVIPQPATKNDTTGIYTMAVEGKSLIGGAAGVVHTNDINNDAIVMAYQVALAINQNGFRAVSQDNKILIIAPDGATLARPVLTVQGIFKIDVGDFLEIGRQGRTVDTLADVASYYYRTDLRSAELGNCGSTPEVCANNVPSGPSNLGPNHQHMVTHTLGLGASGTLRFQENYLSADDSDFRKIVAGTLSWPDPIFFNGPERIDDLWHAAVNGGGRYFNAVNPQSLARSLSSTIAEIRAATGAAAAAATSSQEPAEGDNLLFASSYRSMYWDGELEARRISLSDGSISTVPDWSATRLLDTRVAKSSDTRQIFVRDSSSSVGLKPFGWRHLDAVQQGYFTGLCNPPARLSQCATMSADEKLHLTGERVVHYLRGQSGFENHPDNTYKLFRRREHVLGAPINAPPLYVGRPTFRYADENYGAFRDVEAIDRQSMVYLAANDGMLHAFNAKNGEEIWAFIPPAVLPNVWRSSDMNFDKNFIYLLDGAPVAADICPTGSQIRCTAQQWRTILVNGLGAAGRSYYALDITDPRKPKFLWEFNHDNLGYAMGKPIVTKRRDGTWIVVLASGHKNINPGDGQGRLYVLDAFSGTLLDTVSTGAGTTDNPSGLAHLNAWVDNALDNTALRFYGADLMGNLWRFDIDDLLPPQGKEAVRLAQFIRQTKVQPVTTRVELSQIRSGNTTVPIITVGTGRLLHVSDLTNHDIQSLYTIKDTLTEEGFGDVRNRRLLAPRNIVAGQAGERSVTGDPVDWRSQAGWYLDFDQADALGERVTIDPDQQLGVIRVVTNMPDARACRPVAQSWIYTLDYQHGLYVPTTPRSVAGIRVFSSTMAAGARTIKVGERTMSLVTDDAGRINVISSAAPGSSTPTARRVSWQELDEQ